VTTIEALEEIPQDILDSIGQKQYEETSEFPVEMSYIWTTLSTVENGNPLFWDDDVANELTGGHIAPPTMMSVWWRPHFWAPGRSEPRMPLQVHFDLKVKLGLPEAIITENTTTFYEPVRIGDILTTYQVLRSVSEFKTNRLGRGRYWVLDSVSHNQKDELVGNDSYTAFGYQRVEQTEAK
jgi:acyl dehydratase